MDDASNSNDLAARIAAAVAERLGTEDPNTGRIIADEVTRELLRADSDQSGSRRLAGNGSRVVVTAHGRNRPGIVARLSAAIDEFNGDIQDLSQTIVGDYFTMLFVVDIDSTSPDGARFLQLRKRLQDVAGEIGCHVVVMHDDILSTMHEI